MAVLIEAISLVLRCDAIVKKFSGGIEHFMSSLPNKTLCSDGELACVNFMLLADVKNYVEYLISQGLVFKDSEVAVDLVVVDQKRGMTSDCEWAIFGEADWHNDPACPISVFQYLPSKMKHVVVPKGWTYASSLSAGGNFVDGENIPSCLKFVRSEAGTDVLRDESTGQEFFVRRA